MHDTPNQVYWYEPDAEECRPRNVSPKADVRDTFMQSESLPTDCGIDVRPVTAFPNRSVERAWQAQLEHPPPERSWHVPPGVSDPDLAVGIVGGAQSSPQGLC